MNKLREWLGIEAPRTIYVWHDTKTDPPTEAGMYLVIRENQGKRGTAHFDMFYKGGGWMQIRGTMVGHVVLWTEFPVTPKSDAIK